MLEQVAVEVYLVFNGNCREAVEFYSKVFKTEAPNIMTFGDSTGPKLYNARGSKKFSYAC